MSFFNESLQREIDLIEEDLEELQPQVKRVRADIVRLEKLLQKRKFCIPISIFSHSSREYRNGEDGDFSETREYIDWGELDGHWRLILRREVADGCLALDQNPYTSNPLDQIPLADAAIDAQLRANLVFEKFVQEVGRNLRNHKPTDEALFDEDGQPSSRLQYVTMN